MSADRKSAIFSMGGNQCSWSFMKTDAKDPDRDLTKSGWFGKVGYEGKEPNPPAPVKDCSSDPKVLAMDKCLSEGSKIVSKDCKYSAVMSHDGALTISDSDSNILFQINKNLKSLRFCITWQGIVAMYDYNNYTIYGPIVVGGRMLGKGPFSMFFAEDGNLVAQGSDGVNVWSSAEEIKKGGILQK